MSKFYILGTYASPALTGMMSNPDSDRSAAITQFVESMGGSVSMFSIVRGSSDVIVGIDGLDFDTVASMKIAVMSSGVMTSMDILEEVDMKSIVTKAKTAAENYKKPGE